MIPQAIRDLVARGALFVANHSGGKDSQAMYLMLRDLVPREQLVIVHADLGAVEWAGAVGHILATTAGERFVTCQARRNLLQMIDDRGMFPSPEMRQCTSDLKRGPIEKVIRGITRERQALGIKEWGLVVNCMGMRAQESSGRKKLPVFKLSARNSKAGREWYDWLPIHGMLEDEVFATIAAAGQQPHIVYQLGMRRFSCVFCIMASEEDLKTAARLATERPELLNDPHLYAKYVSLERTTGQVMLMPKSRKGQEPLKRTLEDITGVKADLSVLEVA
ncbi:phosphoadenosine phosphosulfate reductase family protein [Piscinibacter gummiphilus]|uniref:Phosphoadenosine phosphosulfate reductase family protein n=1 Tax=Piscinibacter gummiphilus TaxID=946333 RepID=A0ABZ0CU82_9BURK|nr:phosphoadenosine phosphosulfate reductase family protein [Piscinibacter gummiphilus]WOB06492.1 phosphoadenosine phosphosulfate reductase family protein [Piscinibacter gummiphilus]